MVDSSSPAISLDKLLDIIAHLRRPETGCAWMLEQSSKSIAQFTLEEAYEVVDAIENRTPEALCEELGDLLLQIVLHAHFAAESDKFTLDDIIRIICDKMIRRHPHIFHKAAGDKPTAQYLSWEDIKSEERSAKARHLHPTGIQTRPVSDDIPVAMPALTRAVKLQTRAAQLGFDWPDIEGALDKLTEEVDELANARSGAQIAIDITSSGPADAPSGVLSHADKPSLKGAIEEEFGDILFSLVNVARHLNLDPDTALRRANAKFAGRFEKVAIAVRQSGRPFEDHDLETLERYWQAAKKSL